MFKCICSALLIAAADAGVAQEQPALIPESEIVELGRQLEQAGEDGEPSVSIRRNLKNTARRGLALVEASKDAPNRFRALDIVFQCQKKLLALENVEKNREAMFRTCDELLKAPDEYAELRLEADLMMLEKDMAAKNATLDERAQALAGLIERYHGTRAEAKSLLMGALIVRKLDAPELENAIYAVLDDRFPDDPYVIEFRRKHLKIERLDLSFAGTFRRMDGTEMKFPADVAGHMSLMVFWSKSSPGTDAYLEKLKAKLAAAPSPIEVFSFNVDELPDGGESVLREKGLNWTVMKLEGGRDNQAYRTYAFGDPLDVLVNEYGFSVIRQEIVHGQSDSLDHARISEERFSAQMQSLFIGEFLLNAEQPAGAGGSTQSGLKVVQDCFAQAPFRYRLTRDEALANYSKAEKLCGEMLHQEGGSAHWNVRNYRIIALMGLWRTALEPKCLDEAVREAKVSLDAELPAQAKVIPRFCIATETLRRGEEKPEAVVENFIKEFGGDDASGQAVAAAAVLAIEAMSRDLHEKYRSLFLAKHADNPELYTFASFLRDRYHRYRLLRPAYIGREMGPRGYIVGFREEPITNRLPRIEFRNLDGSKLVLPAENNDKITYLLFVEPPADPAADFPVELDRNGKPTRNNMVRGVVGSAQDLASRHVRQGIDVVVAFLCDDAARVEHLMKTNGWTGRAAIVPGGLTNPMVNQLGILSADRLPNVFILRKDGTIAWSASGFIYKAEFGFPFAFLLAMKLHVEICEAMEGYQALRDGDYGRAAQIFPGPFLPAEPDRFGWRGPMYHGKAIACMGLKQWDAALEALDCAVDDHKLMHFIGRRGHAEEWRKDAAEVVMRQPCDILKMLWAEKADILVKLGREEEAGELRKQSDVPIAEDRPNVYGAFHMRLDELKAELK